MIRAALATLLLATACGARTGLDEPASDAGPRSRFDAGRFTTFPCRWTLGLPSVVAPGVFSDATGAVHPTLDQAAVLATDGRSGATRGAIVSIAASGGVVRALEPEGRGELFTDVTGYVRQIEHSCGLRGHDAEFGIHPAVRWDGFACQLTQSVTGRVESISELGEVLSIRGLTDGAPEVSMIARTAVPQDAHAFHDEATQTTLVARLDLSTLVLERHLASGEIERHVRSSSATRLSTAPDSLRGGMIVHYRDDERGWRLEHLDWEAGRAPEDHFDVSELEEPAGPIATNETEILIPLGDGRIAYIPFALVSLMVRWIDPVDAAPVERMQVILRPNGSAGGVLYQSFDALRFQPLVCNR